VFRTAAIAAIALAAAARAPGADDGLARFDKVDISPTTASLYIATVTMTMPPFSRREAVFSSTYSARVFPYFFWSESGRIWIEVPREKLRRAALGEPVDFTGHGVNESGDERRVEGRATPTGPSSGRILVRVYVTKRIHLSFDTTYRLLGAAEARPGVSPR
jgi:hypothetical protein